MKTKITIALALVTILLMSISVVSFISRDTEAPEITLPEADITYEAGTDQSILLQGVTAYDEEDGDLSDKVRIYDIAVLEDGVRAQVVYAVYDESYNLGKASCIINYVSAGKGKDVVLDTTEDATEEVTEEATEATEEEIEEDTEEVTEEEVDEDSPSPVIRLTNSEVRIDEGGSFNALSYVASATDDEDSREYLYRNIHIDGSYDVNTAGEYTLTYYCMDSDENVSNKAKLKLIVQSEEEETEEDIEEESEER